MEFVFEHATMIAVIAVVVIILAILASGYVKAPPDTAFIISGFQKGQRILIGKAGIKLPFFERLDKLSLKLVAIDVKTSDAVPTADYINIQVDAAVNIKVGDEPQKLQKASQNFLNRDSEYIAKVAREVLEGNMREIVGKMRLEEMVSDRQKFAELVKENAEPDLAAMGLDIISFNVQNFVDSNQVIENLGIDNIVKIKKSAAIARANSEKEIKIAQARANKEANDERVLAETEIAKKNNDLAIKSAELKKESDIKKAEADAAYKIQEEQQRKELEITSANANIARQEREVELRAREVEVTEKSLEAEVKKKAEAERYAKQQQAEADLYRRQKDAEADQFEKIREAEAKKAQAEAQRYAMEQEALGIKAKGEAEAASIRAQALAEAEGMEKKAEAYQRYNKAAMAEMMIKVLPEIAGKIAEPLSQIDKITIIGGGSEDNGIGSVAGNVPVVMAKSVIARDTPLTANDVELKPYNVSAQRRDVLMVLDDAIGFSSKHALQPGRPITKEELVSPVLVGRDQPVMIVYQSAGITASMPGVALKNGRKGELVKVRNASSQRVISAMVAESGVVTTVSAE